MPPPSEANLARLNDLQSYQTVRAPFAGVITVRNIDTGVLVTEGNTLLFRIAQTDRLRTYLNVPQADAGIGPCGPDGHADHSRTCAAASFPGTVTRTANALDPATRTLLVEVQVPNRERRYCAGNVCAGGSFRSAQESAAGDSRRYAGGSRATARRWPWCVPTARCILPRVQLGRDFGDRWKCSPASRKGSYW